VYDGTADNGILEAVEREPRLSDRVAEGILETILSRRLKPGDALPPERELGEQFGVSRTVVREAVRALDAKGLLEVRTGRRIRVARADPKAPRDAIRQFLRFSAPARVKVDELRGELEVAAAGIAADRAGSADLERLRHALSGLEAGGRAAGSAFVQAIIAATHNELFALLHGSFGDPAAELAPGSAAPVRDRPTAAVTLVDAIARHDADAARAAMRDLVRH
jgi:GntR family transcriptional regulator, transcriptional repressor for pyruvate dehydrogenase complex